MVMTLRTKLALFFLVLFRLGHGQNEICIKNNQLLNFLYNDTNAISAIDNFTPVYEFKFFKLSEKFVGGSRQRLIKSKNKLYVVLDGTGRVYEATNATNEEICFTRIDSTFFSGYNGNAIIFEKSDTIFSFGGDGFWRINGQLRFYSKLNHEWNLIQLNKEIPALNHLYYLKANNSKLYYLQLPFIDQATGFKHEKYIITSLDIEKREHTELGELNPTIASKYPDPFKLARVISSPSLQGSFVAYNLNNLFLFDFEKNEVFRLVNQKAKDAFFGNSNAIQPVYTFEKGGHIYYCMSNDSTYQLYSLPISRNDFVKEPYPLYIPFKPIYKTLWFMLTTGMIIIVLIVGIAYFRKKKYGSIKESHEVLNEDGPSEINFSPLEQEMVFKMTENGSKALTVEEINMMLGLSKKTIEIQKKIRTETINKINHKFKIKFDSTNELIERVRMEDDRRYYSYRINEENRRTIVNWYNKLK